MSIKNNNQGPRADSRWRRTKIVATLGPASSALGMIEQLLARGVDAVRLNMSHGDHESHRLLVSRVRRAAERAERHVPIIMDLCGPKIRTGRFRGGGMDLETGAEVVVTTRAVQGGDGVIPCQYRRLNADVAVGERILLDDGAFCLRVVGIEGTEIRCEVVEGGRLLDNKGMNLPDSKVSSASFTDKDKRDAELAIELGVDFLALSFVRNAKDVQRLRRFLDRRGADIPIISKIEKSEAVGNAEEILQNSYAIMIARGDLGIEMPAECVPLIQQDLTRLARRHQRPVIVATQMLQSMMTASQPTRAEVGDVATAALNGVDGVMLSGETASGRYPLQAVMVMDRVVREIEAYQLRQGRFGISAQVAGNSEHDAVANAAMTLAKDLHLEGILIPSLKGTTARIVAAKRPKSLCVAVCEDSTIARRLALHWGVLPVQVDQARYHNDWRELCGLLADRLDYLKTGYTVLVVSGFSDDPARHEPVLKLLSL